MSTVSRITLGCECEAPVPQATSALCATCGLIHMTSDEYRAYLAANEARLLPQLAAEEAPAGQRAARPARRRRLRRGRRQLTPA